MPTRYQRQGVERRRSPRLPVERHATIVFHGRALPCKVINESESGVRLSDFPITSCPDEFALHFGDGDPRQCRAAWRSPVALGVRYLEDERVRRLRHVIAHFEGMLIAGATPEMAKVYRSEIAAAQAMINDLRSAGVAVPELTQSEKAVLSELVREAIKHQRFPLSRNLRLLRGILVKLELPEEPESAFDADLPEPVTSR